MGFFDWVFAGGRKLPDSSEPCSDLLVTTLHRGAVKNGLVFISPFFDNWTYWKCPLFKWQFISSWFPNDMCSMCLRGIDFWYPQIPLRTLLDFFGRLIWKPITSPTRVHYVAHWGVKYKRQRVDIVKHEKHDHDSNEKHDSDENHDSIEFFRNMIQTRNMLPTFVMLGTYFIMVGTHVF